MYILCPFLLLFTCLISSALKLISHICPLHLFLRHWYQSFGNLSSEQFLCTVFTLSISHFPPLPTAFHQVFAISFPFPGFIVSSNKSIYKSGSLLCNQNILWWQFQFKGCCSVSYSSSASLSVCREQYKSAKYYKSMNTEVICEISVYSFNKHSPLLQE